MQQKHTELPASLPMDTDRKIITRLLEEVVICLNEGNGEQLLALHTDDVVLMEPDMPALLGKAAVANMLQKLDRQKSLPQIHFQLHELEVIQDWSFVRGAVTVKKANADGRTEDFQGEFICLLKKQQDGSWLRTHVMMNRDAPINIPPLVTKGQN